MNKLVKGSIAGAAGIALLLGGAGTLAYWNDAVDLGTGGNIATGTLEIDSTTPGAWTGGAIANFVPGDHKVYTETFTINAVGDSLAFDLDTDIDDQLTLAGFTSLTVVEGFAVTGVATGPVTGTAPYTGLEEDTYTVVVTVTVDFPLDASAATGNQVDQTKTLDLSDVNVTVTQNH